MYQREFRLEISATTLSVHDSIIYECLLKWCGRWAYTHLLFKCIYTCTLMWSGSIRQQSHHNNYSLMPAVKGSIRRGCQQRKRGMGGIKTPAECCSNSIISPANDNRKFKSVPRHRLRSGEQSLLFKVTTKQRRGKRLSQHLLALIGELKGPGEKKTGILVDMMVSPSIFRLRERRGDELWRM